jgi:hypothetical protein
LKITRVEGDVSDTHYEDEIEISLRNWLNLEYPNNLQ